MGPQGRKKKRVSMRSHTQCFQALPAGTPHVQALLQQVLGSVSSESMASQKDYTGLRSGGTDQRTMILNETPSV